MQPALVIFFIVIISQSLSLDNCGGCPYGQVCVDTGIRCITEPCPTFRCVANDSCGGCPPWTKCEILFPPCPRCVDRPRCIRPECSPVPTCVDLPPIDECGGCPAGQVCQPTGIVCKKAPCPTHKCVLIAPIRPCTLFCVKGLRCVVRPKECPVGTLYCDKTPVPQCVPIKLGACPKVNYRGIKPGVCLFDGTCNTDDDCSQFERCCETGCYEKKCVGVPVLD